jgi:hypothetical protein
LLDRCSTTEPLSQLGMLFIHNGFGTPGMFAAYGLCSTAHEVLHSGIRHTGPLHLLSEPFFICQTGCRRSQVLMLTIDHTYMCASHLTYWCPHLYNGPQDCCMTGLKWKAAWMKRAQLSAQSRSSLEDQWGKA